MANENKKQEDKKQEERLIRILSTDIPSTRSVYSGLTNIKGVSWSFSNAICNHFDIDEDTTIGDLSEDKIDEISEFIKNPKDIPGFVLNREKDLQTGQDKHLIGSDLELREEFDVKRLKKIKTYRGWRHAVNRPVRGQRTKGNFRSKTTLGVAKTKEMKQAAGAK
jgi:small subunit ribosomal protein S13